MLDVVSARFCTTGTALAAVGRFLPVLGHGEDYGLVMAVMPWLLSMVAEHYGEVPDKRPVAG